MNHRALRYYLKLGILLACIGSAIPGLSQEGFDTTLNFRQIQEVLSEGIEEKDLRKQALAWYHWAIYSSERVGRSDSSLQYMSRAAGRFLESGDSLAYHGARLKMAKWAEKKDPGNALDMLKESLAYYKRSGHLEQEAFTLVEISRVYLANQDTAAALDFRREFRERNQLLKDTILEIQVLMQEVGRLQGNARYRDAINLSLRTRALAQNSRNIEYEARSLYNLGYLSILDEDFEAAIAYLRKAEKLFQTTYYPMRQSLYRHLVHCYELLGKTDSAFYYSQMLVGVTDTILMNDRTVGLRRSAEQFDQKNKDQLIKNLEAEKSEFENLAEDQTTFILVLGIGLAAIILALFFIVRDYRHRLSSSRVIAQQRDALNQQEISKLQDKLQIDSMQSMLEGQEAERRRVANDLHDSVGGLLSATKLQLEQLAANNGSLTVDPDWKKLKGLLDETVSETRHIARNLQPVSLEHFGLERAIQDLVNKFDGEGSPSITYQHYGNLKQLSEANSLHCYRIVQELLQNSLKHGEASEILIQLTGNEREMTILVEDDGKGYDPKTVQPGMGTGNLVSVFSS